MIPDRVAYEGELRRVYAFLMALCFSRLLYVEARVARLQCLAVYRSV